MSTFASDEESFTGSPFAILRWNPLVLYQFVKSQRKGFRIHLRFQQASLLLFFSHNHHQGYDLIKIETQMSMRQRYQARTYLEEIFNEKKMRKPKHGCWKNILGQLAPDVLWPGVPYPSHVTIRNLKEEILPIYHKQVKDILLSTCFIPDVLLKEICEYIELDWLIVEGNKWPSEGCSFTLIFAFCLQTIASKDNLLFVVKWFLDCAGIHEQNQIKTLLNNTNQIPRCGCTADAKDQNNLYKLSSRFSQKVWKKTHFQDPKVELFLRSSFGLTRCYRCSGSNFELDDIQC